MLNDKYRVIKAFRYRGDDYWCFDNAFDMPTARAWAASNYYIELEMRVDVDYLKLHLEAVDKILSDPKKINIGALALIHNNLKERLSFAPFPEHIYKLASVVYFTKEESPYSYDSLYNEKKIKRWKEDPEALAFFLNGPLQALVPYIGQQGELSRTYFQTMERVTESHLKDLHTIISKRKRQPGIQE